MVTLCPITPIVTRSYGPLTDKKNGLKRRLDFNGNFYFPSLISLVNNIEGD